MTQILISCYLKKINGQITCMRRSVQASQKSLFEPFDKDGDILQILFFQTDTRPYYFTVEISAPEHLRKWLPQSSVPEHPGKTLKREVSSSIAFPFPLLSFLDLFSPLLSHSSTSTFLPGSKISPLKF